MSHIHPISFTDFALWVCISQAEKNDSNINQFSFLIMLYFPYVGFYLMKDHKVKLLSCVQLCNPIDSSLPGSSVYGIFQARTLEWVAISFSRGSSQLRDWTQVSPTAGSHFTIWATRKAQSESHSVVSYSLQPHGLYSPWNSPGQNTAVGSLSLLQGIFPT